MLLLELLIAADESGQFLLVRCKCILVVCCPSLELVLELFLSLVRSFSVDLCRLDHSSLHVASFLLVLKSLAGYLLNRDFELLIFFGDECLGTCVGD